MQNYFQHVLLFAKRFFWLILLYFVSRLFFYVLNSEYFSGITLAELAGIFIAGIRFDIAAIVFTNFIFILSLLPGISLNNRSVQKTSDILFFTINAVALLVNFIDARFFDFINKRSTSGIFSLLGANKDVWMLLPRIIGDYWYVALSWIVLMMAFWRWMPRLKTEQIREERRTGKALLYQTVVFACITGLLLLGARGTRLKPISMVDAASYTELKHIPLVLNTPFSIIKTIENENLEELQYFPEDTLAAIYNPLHRCHTDLSFNRLNVVIFILESFSREYCGFLGGEPGYTPEFDSLLARSLVFPNAFANGTQSYEAMAAIIAGIPSLMDRPYGGSNYADNVIESLPWLLRQKGYHTSFFHGGNNGTMGFSNFALIAGIEYYNGRDEYHNDADYDGYWGIWDEPFLQYFARQLSSFSPPFFSSVFTLSSHHPYNVPEAYQHQFKEGKLPILKSIGYADHALGEFFRTVRKMPWYDRTLFIFTADHAAQAVEQEFNSTTGMYAIPLAFYCPSDTTLQGIDNATCQQIDIMPTVLDYLDYDSDYFAFGESLLDPIAPHRCLSYVNGIYQLIQDDYVMQFDGKRVTGFCRTTGTDAKHDGTYIKMETALKAFLQTYNSCLINNRTVLNIKNSKPVKILSKSDKIN